MDSINNNIINIEEHQPHNVVRPKCLTCGYVWIAVVHYQTNVNKLYCPNCKQWFKRLTGKNTTELLELMDEDKE